jgi:hypothetical protein
MPLIIKGNKDIEVISKKDMSDFVKKVENSKKDPLEHLPPEVAKKRREILETKAHREYMSRVQKEQAQAKANLAKKLQETVTELNAAQEAKVQATEELVVTTSVEPMVLDTKDTHVTTIQVGPDAPDFMSMTKKEIDLWAEENLGVQLDRRHTKAKMIEELTKHL